MRSNCSGLGCEIATSILKLALLLDADPNVIAAPVNVQVHSRPESLLFKVKPRV